MITVTATSKTLFNQFSKYLFYYDETKSLQGTAICLLPIRNQPFALEWNQFTVSEIMHDKTNKMTCSPGEDSDQLGHSQSDQSLLAT